MSETLWRRLQNNIIFKKYLNILNSFESPSYKAKDGEPSFILNLFRGQVKPDQIFPYPDVMNVTKKENLKLFIDPLEKMFKKNYSTKYYDQMRGIPHDIIDKFWEIGAFNNNMPTSFGGIGLTNVEQAEFFEIFGKYDLSMFLMANEHQLLGCACLYLFGNKLQQEKYIPGLKDKNKIVAFGLFEHNAEADLTAIQARAVLSKDQEFYLLNGQKFWVVNGSNAEIIVVLAKTYESEEMEFSDEVTAFIVEKSFGEIMCSAPLETMGLKAANFANVAFVNVKVPVANVLGGLGKGIDIAINVLGACRYATVAAISGNMKTYINITSSLVGNKMEFTRPMEQLQVPQDILAQLAITQYAVESAAFALAANADSGLSTTLESAAAKYFATYNVFQVYDKSIQILDLVGCLKPANLEKKLRDVRTLRLMHIENNRLLIALALTGIRDMLSHYKHNDIELRNVAKHLSKLKGNNFDLLVHQDLKPIGSLIAQSVNNFAKDIANFLIEYDEGIIEQQLLLMHLGKIATNIYISALVLSRATRSLDRKFETAEYQKRVVEEFCTKSYSKVTHELQWLQSKDFKRTLINQSEIARAVFKNNEVLQEDALTLQS